MALQSLRTLCVNVLISCAKKVTTFESVKPLKPLSLIPVGSGSPSNVIFRWESGPNLRGAVQINCSRTQTRSSTLSFGFKLFVPASLFSDGNCIFHIHGVVVDRGWNSC
jgi:hypothetical protein